MLGPAGSSEAGATDAVSMVSTSCSVPKGCSVNARGAAMVSLAVVDGADAEDEGDEAEDDGDDAVELGDDAVDVGDDADDEGDEAVDVGDEAVDAGDDAVAEPWLADEPVSLPPLLPPPPPPHACSSARPVHSNAWRHVELVASLRGAVRVVGGVFGV